MAQAKQDMGTGNIKKLMLQLMIPAVVAQVVNLLYNIVDRIYIGHIAGIGAAALTGVGLFTPILMLLNAFAMLVGAGGQAGGSDAANLLKPALARGELRTCAATTWKEYKKYFEKGRWIDGRCFKRTNRITLHQL